MARIPAIDYNELYDPGDMPTYTNDDDPYFTIFDEMTDESDREYFVEPLSPEAEEVLIVRGLTKTLVALDAAERDIRRQKSAFIEMAQYVPLTEELVAVVSEARSERNKEDILGTLHGLDLPKDSYFVIGGANLVLRGIKPFTPDIDILVSDQLFEDLRQADGSKIKPPPQSAILRGATNTSVWLHNANMDVPLSATTMLGDGYFPLSFRFDRERVSFVEGIPCLSLEDVIQAKAHLQRPKDLADLRYIEAFLGFPVKMPERPAGIDPTLPS